MLFYRMFLKVIKMNNKVLFISSSILIVGGTLLIVFLEPETFPTYFEGLWWVMTTVTTVGYGDYFPVTTEGRLFAIFLYIFGIGLIGVLIGKIVDWFAGIRQKRVEGRMAFKGKDQIVIIGWSQKAAVAVEEITESLAHQDIVIIDQLEKAPILGEFIHYIRGNASRLNILEQANIKEAKAVLIFSDDNIKDTVLSDGKTLIIASSVESIAPDAHTTVEIMDEEHIRNFEHVKVDEFLLSHDIISRVAVRSAFTKGISNVYNQLISRKHGDDLYQIKKQAGWETYRDAFNELLNQGATLISDRQNLSINRHLDEKIPDDAELYVICDTETYESIRAK